MLRWKSRVMSRTFNRCVMGVEDNKRLDTYNGPQPLPGNLECVVVDEFVYIEILE